jgi:hypothetical protein
MTRLSPYLRPKDPEPVRLTRRDEQIFEMIHTFDGLLSLRQIDQLFFAGNGRTQPRARMRSLFHNGYVNMPDVNQHRRYVPQGETCYFLDKKGAEIVAALHGEELAQFRWRDAPRWSLIAHDLKVNDFRLAVMQACAQDEELSLYEWIPEGDFLVEPERVTFQTTSGHTRTRQFRPDGFFRVRRPSLRYPGKFEDFAFLLEVDMGTEDNPRFVREKVRPGISYLKSEAYQERFGVRYGRWLVVVNGGEMRLRNMKEHTERAGGSGFFYFTTFDKVAPLSVITEPIWFLAGEDSPRPIILPQAR